jgi:addiction module HigA family antidote
MTKRAPIHPGYILETEFLDELGLSAYALAKALRVPVNRITGIIKGKRAITADTALRLARYFDTTPEFWLNLQTHYDLVVTSRQAARKIDREVPRMAANGRGPLTSHSPARYRAARSDAHTSKTEAAALRPAKSPQAARFCALVG